MNRLGLIAAWIGVTALTTFFAWQIVSAADAQVTERPLSVVAAAPPEPVAPVNDTASPATIESGGETTTTTSSPPVTTTVPSTTLPTTGGSSSTVTSSPATTVPESWSIRTIPTAGGTVVVKYRTGEVVLEAASPAPGYSVEIEKAGPPKVEVEFESVDDKVEVKAEWSDGDLVVEVSEEDHND